MSFHGGSPCNARSVAQSLGRMALFCGPPSPRHQDSTRPLMKPGVSTSLRRLFAGNERLHGRDSRPVLAGARKVTLIATVAGVRSHPGLLAIVDFSVVVGARLVGVRAALAVAPRVLHVLRKVTARLLVRIVRRHPVASLALSAGSVAVIVVVAHVERVLN